MNDGHHPQGHSFDEISTVDGSFYKNYRDHIIKLLSSIVADGMRAQAGNRLVRQNAHAMAAGINIVQKQIEELPQILNKIFDEENATYWEECLLSSIIGIVEGVFVTAKHGDLTDSVLLQAQMRQVELMNDKKKEPQQNARARRGALVRKHAALLGADLAHPSSTADAIHEAVNKELKSSGRATVTPRTIQNWINELKN